MSEYLSREVLESHRPIHGRGRMFIYLESRSDIELSKTKISTLVHYYDYTVRGIYPVGEDTTYVTRMDIYYYSRADDPELYLKLLANHNGIYVKPTKGRVPRDLIVKILEIDPLLIDQFPICDIDPEYYIEDCMASNRIYHAPKLLTKKLLDVEKFLFFCWNKHAGLMLHFTEYFNQDMFARFLEQYPHNTERYTRIYLNTVTKPTVRTKTIVPKITKEEFMDPGNRHIPGRLSAEMLSDEDVVLKIIELKDSYMTGSEYRRKFVTKAIFDKVYLNQSIYFIKAFVHHFDPETFDEYYRFHPTYENAFHDLYTTEHWITMVGRDNELVLNITDFDLLREVVAQYPELESYLDLPKIELMKSFRKKSARSIFFT